MPLIPETIPDVGVYQSLRYDSVVQLGAAATIAHAHAIEYCTEQGIDHSFVVPREVFGFTLTSRRDVRLAADQLLENHFDTTAFARDVAAIPLAAAGPIRLTNAFATNRYAGFKLHPEDRGELVYRSGMVRFTADYLGGVALPVRQKFDHVTLLLCNVTHLKTRRTPARLSGKIREIVAAAQAEVGLEEIYLGKLMVGYEIGKPLPY